MIVNTELNANRVLLSQEEARIRAPWPVISRYFWKAEGESYIPYLLVDEGTGRSYAVRLEGELSLVFGAKHCLQCGDIIPWDNKQALCELCQQGLSYTCRRCLFEGPGKPFGTTCSPTSPPCNLPKKAAQCWGEYFVYLGHFGRLNKVGISSCSRSEGKYYRVVEQGLEGALVLRSFKSLAQALQAEATLSDVFGFSTALTFQQKVEEIASRESPRDFAWHTLAEDVQKTYPHVALSYLDLSDLWTRKEQTSKISIVHRPKQLVGEPICSQGNVLIIKSCIKEEERYFAYNLSYLAGYELLPFEEQFQRSSAQEAALLATTTSKEESVQ